MSLPAEVDKAQEDEARAQELSNRALVVIREGLEEPTTIRKRVFELLVDRLNRDEIRTLVKDIGFKGIRRLLPFL